jgi:Protein of unknown function (DUF3829)
MQWKQVLMVVPVVAGIGLFNAYQGGHLNGLIGSAAKLKGAAPPSKTLDVLSPGDRALSDKLQPLIVCINRVDTTMRENIELYRQQFKVLSANPVNPQWGLTVNRFRSFKIAPFEQANNFSVECAAGLDKAQALPPKDDPLDKVALSYAATLRALIPHLNAADLYYGQKDFADDKMAKGKTLDASLAPLFTALIQQSEVMRAVVGERNDTLRASQLAAVEKASGRNIEWQTLNVMIVARRTFMDLQASATRKALTKVTVAAAELPLQTAFDDAKTLAATVKLPAEGSRERKPVWFDVDASAASFLGSVKDLRRELEAGKPEVVVGYAIDSVVRNYNSLVSAHNRASRF